MKRLFFIFLLTVFPLVMMHLYNLECGLITPLLIEPKVGDKNPTLEKLKSMGIDSEVIAQAVDLASRQSGLSTEFLMALMYTESEGKVMAVSCKGYKGLMQIPYRAYYPDANMLIGAHIFNEKMKEAHHNVEKALCLYKGYPIGSERGEMKARQVLRLRDRLRKVKV